LTTCFGNRWYMPLAPSLRTRAVPFLMYTPPHAHTHICIYIQDKDQTIPDICRPEKAEARQLEEDKKHKRTPSNTTCQTLTHATQPPTRPKEEERRDVSTRHLDPPLAPINLNRIPLHLGPPDGSVGHPRLGVVRVLVPREAERVVLCDGVRGERGRRVGERGRRRVRDGGGGGSSALPAAPDEEGGEEAREDDAAGDCAADDGAEVGFCASWSGR
jgi:hypothetical protein